MVILTLTSIPSMSLPKTETIGFDKIAHFSVYLIFSILFMLRKTKATNSQKLKILLLLSILVPLFDELHQIPIRGRYFSFYDLFADFLGFIITFLFFYKENYKKIILKPLRFCCRLINTILFRTKN